MMDRFESMCGAWGAAVGRVLLGALFVVAGYQKLAGGVAGFAGFCASLGVPAPELMAWVVIAVELIGGAMLILGWKTKLAAQVLIVFTIIATFLAHQAWSDPSQMTMFLKNLAIIGGLFYATAYGGGKCSADQRTA